MDHNGFRFFMGCETKQVDYEGRRACPTLWYFEPADYDGDRLWSFGYLTLEAAIAGHHAHTAG